MSADLNKVHEDLGVIWGAAGIAKALGLKDNKAGRRKIFHMLEKKQLPGFKFGKLWHLRKSRAKLHMAELEDGETA